MDFMPSNKWAVDLVQSSDVCVHHCSGIITTASNALNFVIMSQYGLVLHLCVGSRGP